MPRLDSKKHSKNACFFGSVQLGQRPSETWTYSLLVAASHGWATKKWATLISNSCSPTCLDLYFWLSNHLAGMHKPMLLFSNHLAGMHKPMLLVSNHLPDMHKLMFLYSNHLPGMHKLMLIFSNHLPGMHKPILFLGWALQVPKKHAF